MAVNKKPTKKTLRVEIKFESEAEYEEYVARVAEVGGKLGAYGRIVLLRDARAKKAEAVQ